MQLPATLDSFLGRARLTDTSSRQDSSEEEDDSENEEGITPSNVDENTEVMPEEVAEDTLIL